MAAKKMTSKKKLGKAKRIEKTQTLGKVAMQD